MLEHERRCFAVATGRDEADLDFHNVVGSVPSRDEVVGHDAMLIGGSGDFSLSAPDHPFFQPMADLLRVLVRRRFPIFGSCFGYQLLVDALGGRVERDMACSEVGSFNVTLTGDGRCDDLFGQLPDRFVAQMGHLDRATVLPPALPNLATSRRCPNQALRVPGAPIWATQFHPELDHETNLDRCVAYAKQYVSEETTENRGSLPSPDAATILRRFLDLAVPERVGQPLPGRRPRVPAAG